MAEAIIWADKLPDIIKKWILIVPMVLAVGGSSTGIYQYFDKQDVIKDKNKAVREVATAFQSMMPESPKEKKTIIYTQNCNTCKALIEDHKEELH